MKTLLDDDPLNIPPKDGKEYTDKECLEQVISFLHKANARWDINLLVPNYEAVTHAINILNKHK